MALTQCCFCEMSVPPEDPGTPETPNVLSICTKSPTMRATTQMYNSVSPTSFAICLGHWLRHFHEIIYQTRTYKPSHGPIVVSSPDMA